MKTFAIVCSLAGVLVAAPLSGRSKPIELQYGQVRISLSDQTAFWWSYKSTSNMAPIQVTGPTFEVNGVPITDSLSELKQSALPVRLPNGVMEYRYQGVYTHHDSLKAVLVFRLSTDSPIVRFQYEISGANGERLTRSAGADRLDYAGITLTAFPSVREVRLSEFQEATHSFTLSERLVEQKEFDNSLHLMGPLLAASNGASSMLLAYEHGSQVPDAFLEFRLTPERRVTLAAVKGNYLSGQKLAPAEETTEGKLGTQVPGYAAVWMQMGAVSGGLDTLASTYRQFILRDLSVSNESRKPYIFYNTWNFQERNKWWYHHPYLDSMNEERMLKEIDVAHRMGIDVFVLDTGWYEKTGDWPVSLKRFPHGLAPLQEKLKANGMRLGLWFNPTAAAVSSSALRDHRETVVSHHGKEGQPTEIWETEASQSMCLVSRYSDAFADTLIRVARETGARYFKWDAIGQYGCDSPNHNHGTNENSPEERSDSYAFQLPLYMARIVAKVQAAVPDAIVDFDITEGGRAVGLSFLSAGKYFLINNGPYKFNYDLPMDRDNENWNLFFWPGPARTWIARTPLTYDKWIPSVLFLTHYLPDDPKSSQVVNLASLILGQNGIWGDLLKVSPEGVSLIGNTLMHYKQVREDITSAYPVRSGGVGGTPEIHEKIAASGKGAVVIFATTTGDFTYVTEHTTVKQHWDSGGVSVDYDQHDHARIHAHFSEPGARIVLFGTQEIAVAKH